MSMYFYYVRNTIKSWFQYKLDACLRSFAVFLREAAGIIIIYLTLKSFDQLNGWNTMELFFLYFIRKTGNHDIISYSNQQELMLVLDRYNTPQFLEGYQPYPHQ